MSSVFQKLIAALKPLNIPYSVDFQSDDYSEYFTIAEADDRGDNYGDDKPGTAVVSVDVHWFLPLQENYISKKTEIRKAIFGAGFSFPEVTVIPDADLQVRHVVFSCSIADGTQTEGL